jgi:[ribosomal protein S5]-alanine N-acetyltransferase
MNAAGAANSLKLNTSRLEIIAATIELVLAEMQDLPAFSTLLNVPQPSTWPPPLNDEDSQRYTLNALEHAAPADAGWSVWYCILREPRALTGIVAYKSAPRDGYAELGYSLLEEFQGRGFCTEAVRELIRWGFQNSAVHTIVAATLPELVPSIRVMERCGMRFAGNGMEDGVQTIRYELTRKKYLEIYKSA